jgi:hypothetical protein
VDVKPLLVPISKRSVLGAVEILLLHAIPEGQIHSTSDFGAALGPFLPQAELISKEVKMGLDSPIGLTQVDENRNKEDRVGMQIANPNLVIQTKTLKERMDWNPKTLLEEIFKNNYLTKLGIGVVVAACWPPSCKLPVVKHAQADEVVDGRFGGF